MLQSWTQLSDSATTNCGSEAARDSDTSKQAGLCPTKQWTLTFKSQIILTYYEIVSFLFFQPFKCVKKIFFS